MRVRRVVAVSALTLTAALAAAPAWADATYPPSGPPPSVTVTPGTEVQGVQLHRQSNNLPFTGQDILAMSVVGGVVLVGGAGLVVATRRRAGSHS